MSSSLRKFLECLLCASAKAGLIARECRKEKDLFGLLVEEKGDGEKNAKFVQDFKTLADVLIQQTVKHDLGRQFPKLADHIKGEESNVFTNTLGESVEVSVKATEEETSKMLCKVLDKNKAASDILARLVHSKVTSWSSGPIDCHKELEEIPTDLKIDVDDLGIWIDPIDSTNNYVRGLVDAEEYTIRGDVEMTSKGLQVVTVLIGVFDRSDGKAVAGVINQPFARWDQQTEEWRGYAYWGACMGNSTFASPILGTGPAVTRKGDERPQSVVSFTEEETFKERLFREFDLCSAAGAGYKLLCVARGFVSCYVTEKASVYKWDSCAAHAIIKAIGGNCLNLRMCLENADVLDDTNDAKSDQMAEIVYHEPLTEFEGIAQWSNCGGIVAYINRRELLTVKEILRVEVTSIKIEDDDY